MHNEDPLSPMILSNSGYKIPSRTNIRLTPILISDDPILVPKVTFLPDDSSCCGVIPKRNSVMFIIGNALIGVFATGIKETKILARK